MTESEFLSETDHIFSRIEMALDDVDFDIDAQRSGNVLELEFDDGSKVIVNRHVFNQEVWIAARSGGYHYRHDGQHWTNTRGDGEFFTDLAAAITLHAGEAFSFA